MTILVIRLVTVIIMSRGEARLGCSVTSRLTGRLPRQVIHMLDEAGMKLTEQVGVLAKEGSEQFGQFKVDSLLVAPTLIDYAKELEKKEAEKQAALAAVKEASALEEEVREGCEPRGMHCFHTCPWLMLQLHGKIPQKVPK